MTFNTICCALVLLVCAPSVLKVNANNVESATEHDLPYLVQPKSDAGYVLEVEGKWYVKAKQYLAVGQRVAAGDVIRILSPTESDHIVIAGMTGQIIAKRHCGKETCARGLVVPAHDNVDRGLFNVILDTAMRLIRGKPDRYSVHGVRGVDNELREAVCVRDGASVELSPAFHNMTKGVYYLKLREVDSGAGKPALGPFRFDWDPKQTSTLQLSDLSDGTYEIRLMTRVGDHYETTPLTVWVLFSGKQEFNRLTDLFRQATTVTDTWQTSTTDETKRTVLRAYLHSLAKAPL
jgi:hypothetical protein